jgi:hypothetical protein
MIACLLEDLDEKNATAFSNPQMGPELHGACYSKNPKISFFLFENKWEKYASTYGCLACTYEVSLNYVFICAVHTTDKNEARK